MRPLRDPRPPRRRDDGVVLVIVAISMVAILFIVALVLDLSNVRNSRQDTKSTTDAVAAAGAQSLAADGKPRPWKAACTSLAYLRANEPDRPFTVDYMDGAKVAVSGAPCTDKLGDLCVANTPSTFAWIRATHGDYIVDIRAGYTTPDPDFPEDTTTYSGDDAEAARGGCDQLAVINSRSDPAFFGGIGNQTSYETAGRTVARVTIESKGEGVPAFIMLERISCKVLSQSVGASEGGIIVEAPSATEPGAIHIDSAATSGCTGGPNSETNFAVFSATLGSSPKRPGLSVEGVGTDPGLLSMYALQNGSAANAWATTDGVSANAIPGNVVSRQPVDDKYNSTAGTPTITNLHAETQPLANLTASPDPLTYTTVTTCTGHATTPEEAAASKVFVDCPSGYSPSVASFTAATDVIFNGPVNVPNGSELYMPAAKRVVVGGTSSGGLSVAGGGRLGINSVSPFADDDAGVRAACTGREGPTYKNTTQLIVFGGRPSGGSQGALNVGGRAALCQTFAYLAGPKTLASHVPQSKTDGTDHSTCIAPTPCPKSSGNVVTNAHLNVSGYVRWSAPNQLDTPPPDDSVGVEDLALWTETAAQSDVNGTLDIQGVYFLPNARMETRSPANLTPRDAQFIARSLKLLQGTLQMEPTPANTVQVDILASVALVR